MAKAPYKHPTVFVGAPFAPASTFAGLKKALDNVPLEFLFADSSIKTKQLLERVRTGITRADYSLFDITGWNPNVTLELGLAEGLNEDYYVLFKPGKGAQREPPADLRGLQRITYKTLAGMSADSLEYQLDDLLVKKLTHPRYIHDQLAGPDRTKKFMFAMRILAYYRSYRLLRRIDLPGLSSGSYLRKAGIDEVMELLRSRKLITGSLTGRQWRAGRNLYKGITA